jgi:hypothetical protein
MEYYIFLKSLRSLEEFRKNPHVKIPPKSPSTNFQSLGKFKNPIFNSEILFLDFDPADPAARSASGIARIPAAPSPLAKIVPASPSSPARRSRLCEKYVFPFESCLPEPATSPSSLCQPGPTCQIHPHPRRRPTPVRNSPRRRSPVPLPRTSDAPELL